MAKLDFAANQIQSTTNMIKSSDTATAWNDEKYPSANAVVAKITEMTTGTSGSAEYPIGSVIMTHKELATGETSAAANPSTLLGLPGTWTLIDKEFKSSVSGIGGPGNEVSPTGAGFYLSGETAIRTDHTILLQIGVSVSTSSGITAKPNVEAITMATLNLSRYGISGLERGTGNEIAFATDTNGTSGAICYYITKEGVLTLYDVLGGAGNRKLNNNTFMHINTVIPIIDHTLMIDSFCDKFYWKRTA